MQHTPGPWFVEGMGGITMDGFRDGYIVGSEADAYVLRTFGSRVPRAEQYANALLAAAAPGLMALAEDILAYCNDPRLVAQAERAVAVARGESP